MVLFSENIADIRLNEQGYFTIRGTNIGEIDETALLAMRVSENSIECRHIEVRASMQPTGYIIDEPKEIGTLTVRSPKSFVNSTTEELELGVNEWIEEKFNSRRMSKLRQKLYPGTWSCELVVLDILHPEELDLFREAGIKVFNLRDL